MGSGRPDVVHARPVDAATRPASPSTLRPPLAPGAAIAIAFVLLALIAAADYVSSFEVRLGILYVVPVALATWVCGRGWGLVFAVLAPVAWGLNLETLRAYSNPAWFWWDGVVLGATLALFAELLSRLRRALEHSDERFVRVLDGIDAAFFVADGRGEVLYANRKLVKLAGDGPALPTAQGVAALFVALGDRAKDGPAGEAWPDGTELAGVRDGRRYITQTRDITWVDGRDARLVVLTDVTDQSIAQELKRDHREALHRTAQIVALSETAATLAHELNQPLIAIVGYNAACARLLDAPDADPSEIRDAMEKCRAQAVRAGEILKRLRELTRRRTPEVAPCDLNALVRTSVAWAEPDLERARVRVELDLARPLPPISADHVLVEQVMMNLVQNAIDAMREVRDEDRRLAIASSVDADGMVRVTVSDRGRGLSPDVAERLYSPFFTTKASGLGLGLSICRSIVEMHGGRIGHGAGPGGGASFHFTLPTEAR